MIHFEGAVERIRQLECPTGEIEVHVEEILGAGAVVSRKQELDRGGAQAYSAAVDGESLTIYAKSGLDDYVARVVAVQRS